MNQETLSRNNQAVRSTIYQMIEKIEPFDELEVVQIAFVISWLNTGVEIFRIEKPATPDIHLVLFLVYDDIKLTLESSYITVRCAKPFDG